MGRSRGADADVLHGTEGPLRPSVMKTRDFSGPAIYRRRFDKMVGYDLRSDQGHS
jgi:hypothetical protein